MVTIPARRSIFTSRRIFPFRNFVPNEELGQSPGWLPIEDTERTFTSEFRRRGYWTAQVSDNPHLGFTKAYRALSQELRPLEVGGRPGGLLPLARDHPAGGRLRLAAAPLRDDRYMPGMRKYLANSGGGVNEEETCAARLYKEAADTLDEARLRQPFCLTVDCFDPHEPWSPPPKYVDMYKDPSYEGPNIGVTKYGFARNFSDAEIRHLHAIYAAEVTMTDAWLGHFMARFYELGLDENTVIVLLSDHGYLLGERGYTGKVPSQLHPELAQVPFVIVAPRRPGRRRDQHLLRLDPRRRAHAAVDGGPRAAELDGGHRPLPRPRRRPPGRARATSTTAACTTASSSAPTTGS